MKITKKKMPSRWFEYPNSDGATVLFELIPSYRKQSMMQGALIFNDGSSDVSSFSDMIIAIVASSIKDWNKIEDADTGRPLEVNNDNKIMLLNHEDVFSWAQKCLNELEEEANKKEEEQEKN